MRRRIVWVVVLLAGCEGQVLTGPGRAGDPFTVPPAAPVDGAPVACTPAGPGRAALRRLTTTQVRHALQDVLGLEQPVTAELPPELLSPQGYDGDGAFQTFPPELVVGLLDATQVAITSALATPGAAVSACPGAVVPPLEVAKSSPWVFLDVQGTTTRPVTGAQRVASWLVYDIPPSAVTADYETLVLHATAVQSGGVWPQLQVNFNDVQVVAALSLDSAGPKTYAIPLPVRAGVKAKIGLYLKNAAADGSRSADVTKVELLSRATRGLEPTCVRATVSKLGRLAFRRTLGADELDTYSRLALQAADGGLDPKESLALAVQALLVSPSFLFHAMDEQAPDDATAVHRLSGRELAARLATFLWVSVPDEALLEAAENGALDSEAGVRAQVDRMLADPRARRMSEAFVGQWLQTRGVAEVSRASTVISSFDAPLRQAMQAETAALFHDVLTRDASPVELFTASHTFVDARLAAFYGLPPPVAAGLTRVQLDGVPRRGVLSHASVMTITSKPDHSSPVGRGVFVLGQVLCNPPGSPPQDASMDLSVGPSGEDLSNRSPREQLTAVTSPARCQGCHARINPIGFAFEHFDAVGRWRDRDGAFAIDASGELPGVGRFQDHLGLVDLVGGAQRTQLERCVTKHLLTFAVGRAFASAEQCTIDTLAGTQADARGLKALVAAIATSEPFRARRGGN